MTDQQTFNPQNRYCIANGKEGCPACLASLHSVRNEDIFAIPPHTSPEELVITPEMEIMGLCLISSSQIIIGSECGVDDGAYQDFVSATQ